MKRLTITSKHEELVRQFVDENMLYKHPHDEDISQSCKKLRLLANALEQGWHAPLDVIEKGVLIYPKRPIDDLIDYLEKIRVEYRELLRIHPKDMEDKAEEFKNIIPPDEISKIRITRVKDLKGNPLENSDEIFFHELIVQYMRYAYVQSTVFPQYVRLMGIKTCVYCNSQYTITTRNNKTFYQLDHCWPKSKYPFFSSSFYNLQPSCGTCNLYKSDNEMRYGNYTPSIWKEADDTSTDYFIFQLKDDAIVRYELSGNTEELEVDFKLKNEKDFDAKKLWEDYQKYFHIDELYAEHKDVIEELIWKKQAYSNGYLESLMDAFEGYPVAVDIPRLFIGNYTNDKDILKRPLSKMVQDIAKQLGLKM